MNLQQWIVKCDTERVKKNINAIQIYEETIFSYFLYSIAGGWKRKQTAVSQLSPAIVDPFRRAYMHPNKHL
jgi:hypothetical protein